MYVHLFQSRLHPTHPPTHPHIQVVVELAEVEDHCLKDLVALVVDSVQDLGRDLEATFQTLAEWVEPRKHSLSVKYMYYI